MAFNDRVIFEKFPARVFEKNSIKKKPPFCSRRPNLSFDILNIISVSPVFFLFKNTKEIQRFYDSERISREHCDVPVKIRKLEIPRLGISVD